MVEKTLGLWGFGSRLRSSLQRWHCGEGHRRWPVHLVVFHWWFQCRYPTRYSFDMFWSSIFEGWNHHRPTHMWNVFFYVCQQESHQNKMFLANIDEHLSICSSFVGCFAIKCLYVMTSRPDMEGLHHFQDVHSNTPPKTKTDLFNPIAAKALCLPETLGTVCASTNLSEVGFFRNLEERSWFIMWTKLRDLLRIQKWGIFMVFYGEFLGSETLQDFQGPNHWKSRLINVYPLKRYQWSDVIRIFWFPQKNRG